MGQAFLPARDHPRPSLDSSFHHEGHEDHEVGVGGHKTLKGCNMPACEAGGLGIPMGWQKALKGRNIPAQGNTLGKGTSKNKP